MRESAVLILRSKTTEDLQSSRGHLAFREFSLWIRADDLFWVRLYRDLHGCALLQTHLFAILILEGILDTDLSIKMIGAFHCNLRLFRLARMRRLYDFVNRAGQSCARFFGRNLFCRDELRSGGWMALILSLSELIEFADSEQRRIQLHRGWL